MLGVDFLCDKNDCFDAFVSCDSRGVRDKPQPKSQPKPKCMTKHRKGDEINLGVM